MGFLNLGHKDAYGKQRRIEHRGKYLRASRTGGVALRAQAQALGANLTANSNRGFRVSTTPLPNTQMALQNGRFVLRGRYGRGPLKLNLSKTGVSVASSNALGSFNWFKPQRSSAKLFGVQVRGRKAAHLQLAYMGLMAAALVLSLAVKLLVGAFTVLLWIAETGYRAVLAAPYALRMLWRRWQRKRLAKKLPRLEAACELDLESWSPEGLLAGALLLLAGWGRGRSAAETVSLLQPPAGKQQHPWLVRRCSAVLGATAEALDQAGQRGAAGPDTALGLMALFGQRLARGLPDDEVSEAFLEMDEVVLQEGARTVFQERLLEVFGDFAGLAFVQAPQAPADDAEPVSEGARDVATPEREAGAGSGSDDAPAVSNRENGRVDINTASAEALQRLPHIGPERAEAIIAGRPWASVAELHAVDGIGSGRLADIEPQAVAGASGGGEEDSAHKSV